MRINEDRSAGGPIIRAFTRTGFRLDAETVLEAALLTVDTATSWSPPPLSDLDEAALAIALEPLPEFVLIGSGSKLARPPKALIAALEARDIGVEPMDSRAAARAWGVLRGEGRIIAAALYPIDYIAA